MLNCGFRARGRPFVASVGFDGLAVDLENAAVLGQCFFARLLNNERSPCTARLLDESISVIEDCFARLVSRDVEPGEALVPFELWGPTCDSIDYMKGPFMLPASVEEGDYLEIGNMGAYGRAIAGHFNGYGEYDEVILLDEPMLSMYDAEVAQMRSARR